MYHSQKEENIAPFNELILTWNGQRPKTDIVKFYVRVKTKDWSPYFLYASWGDGFQSTHATGSDIQVFQDLVTINKGPKATGYEVRVEGANPNDYRYHVFVNDTQSTTLFSKYSSIRLDVSGISQQKLEHPSVMDLCSPTSTSAVVQYLKGSWIDSVEFAKNVWDYNFDIYGNWVLNMAHASSILGKDCWVERLSSFDHLYAMLINKTPVIVSVRGPLKGSALPYAKGHLLVVIGFDAQKEAVLCMDPAFPSNEETFVTYPIQDFIEAWSRKGFVSYLFEK